MCMYILCKMVCTISKLSKLLFIIFKDFKHPIPLENHSGYATENIFSVVPVSHILFWTLIFIRTFICIDNIYLYTKGRKNLLVGIIDRGHIAVDIFLFFSGFLNVYNFYMREKENKIKGKKPTKFTFYSLFDEVFKRYIRYMYTYTPYYVILHIKSRTFD